MKKNFLIVTDFYKPHTSGITSYIDFLINFLLKNNFRITILTIKHQNNLNSFEECGNIKIIRSKPTFHFSRGFYSLDLIKNFIKLKKENHFINIHYPIAEIFPLIFFFDKNTFFSYHCVPFYKSFLLKFIKIYFYIF